MMLTLWRFLGVLARMVKVVTMLFLPLHFSAEQLLCERVIFAGFVRLVVVVMVITALVFVDVRVQVELLRLLVFFLCGSCSPLHALQSIALTQQRRGENDSKNGHFRTENRQLERWILHVPWSSLSSVLPAAWIGSRVLSPSWHP
jgi:hypothetical protein